MTSSGFFFSGEEISEFVQTADNIKENRYKHLISPAQTIYLLVCVR